MNKIVLLILAGTLVLLTEGCTFFSEFADSRRKLDELPTEPAPTNTVTNQAPSNEEDEELFSDLEGTTQPPQQISGLIPSTNPDVRVRSSVRGRNDPFSLVTLNPLIEIEQDEVTLRPARSNIDLASNSDSLPERSETLASDNSDSIVAAATPFDPVLAKRVVISGLFEANGKTRLIVQAPEESTSRYVEVGQYLSNGQVLVKRIDKNHFPYPMVILEQEGIEVTKVIGDEAEIANENTASLPQGNSLEVLDESLVALDSKY